jgi:O-6-methylguanine DNA methyltransferase
MPTLARTYLDTPLGEMLALASDNGLSALEFDRERHDRLAARLRRWFPSDHIEDRETPILARTREWLAAYFEGRIGTAADLPLDMRGGSFELRVWAAIREIPIGETTSYGTIAMNLGSPGASRAVGAANGANPIAIIVPCHRVIGASGSLTGYGGGLVRKTWLLDHERRCLHARYSAGLSAPQ